MSYSTSNLVEKKDQNNLLVIISVISFSNLLVIFWDIYGLNAIKSPEYFASKFVFILLPFVLHQVYKLVPKSRSFIHPLISINYFLYSYYYMTTLHYSYFTAFIQFFLGLVLFFRYTTLSFILTFVTGVILFHLGVNGAQNHLSDELYLELSQVMYSCFFPIVLVVGVLFFFHQRTQKSNELQSLFFEEIGRNVGFILHEVKRPLMRFMSDKKTENSSELLELLETANLLWPSKESKKTISKQLINIDEEVRELSNLYTDALTYKNINLKVQNSTKHFESNKNIVRIILKNLIKNAIEYLVDQDFQESSIYISLYRNNSKTILSVSNPLADKNNFSTKSCFDPGYSTKGSNNKGIGLFISKELASKINANLKVNKKENFVKFTLSLT
jgi:signal transduction histidine kinase